MKYTFDKVKNGLENVINNGLPKNTNGHSVLYLKNGKTLIINKYGSRYEFGFENECNGFLKQGTTNKIDEVVSFVLRHSK